MSGADVDDFDAYLADSLRDPEFAAAYADAGDRERLLDTLFDVRRQGSLTQAVVAQRMGTTQSAVSDLEGGLTDPRLSTLQRYARAVGWRVVLGVESAPVEETP